MKAAIIQAVAKLGALTYFPSDPGARQALMELLGRMVSTPEQLDWLVRTLVDRVGTYPGPAEIRGLFCTRFRPKDGVEVNCSLSGFSPADQERRYLQQAEQWKAEEQLPAPALKQILGETDV